MNESTTVRFTGTTDRGLVRTNNEDCIGWNGWSLRGRAPAPLALEIRIERPTVIVVADGMGGHAGGEEASRIACEVLTAPGALVHSESAAATREPIRALIQEASDTINSAAEENRELHGMGCTVAGVVVHPNGSVLVFNVGDSRVYRVEGEYLAQLTVDHRSSSSNALTQALGGGRRVVLEPDFFDCHIPDGPGLVLCTDGLDDYADQAAMETACVENPVDLPLVLRDLAFAGGGGDNVTVVQLTCTSNDYSPAPTTPGDDHD
ncbi:PP2C family protein-serine/threonine phosphatase [Rhodococcus sp. 5G237]